MKWIDTFRNEEMLRCIKETRSIITVIRNRRDGMIGHILRHETLLVLLLQIIAVSRIGQGMPRLRYIKLIIRNVGPSKVVTSYFFGMS